MIKQGHIGAARAFLDLGYSPDQVKLAFLNQGMSAADAAALVKEAFIPVGAIGAIVKGIGGLLGRTAVGKAPGLVSGAGQGILKGPAKNTVMARMQSLKSTPGLLGEATTTTGAQTGSLTGKLMQGGGMSQAAGKGLHSFGGALQRGVAGFQGGPGQIAKHIGGGALNFGKGMFFMGSKNPSAMNMAGKGYGAYGMGSMILGPGSTPMPTPQM